LHWAAAKDQMEVTRLLLENKADINAKDNMKLTPLMWALDKGHTDVAKLLRANGAGK
jgi:GA-binding protein transcription factor beta